MPFDLLVISAQVASCTIYMRKQDERFAMVKLHKSEDCQQLIDTFNNVELDGKVVAVAMVRNQFQLPKIRHQPLIMFFLLVGSCASTKGANEWGKR